MYVELQYKLVRIMQFFHYEVANTVCRIALLIKTINQLCALNQYFSITHLFNLQRFSAPLLRHRQGGFVSLFNIQHIYKCCITPCIMWHFTSYSDSESRTLLELRD